MSDIKTLEAERDIAIKAGNWDLVAQIIADIKVLSVELESRKEWLDNNKNHISETSKAIKEAKTLDEVRKALLEGLDLFPAPAGAKKTPSAKAGKGSYKWNPDVNKNCLVDESGNWVKKANNEGVVGLVFKKGPGSSTPIR